MPRRLLRLLVDLADALFPPACAACDEARRPAGGPFCDACRLTLDEVPPVVACPADWPLARLVSPFAYGGALAAAIVRCKHAARPDLAAALARLACAAAPPPPADLVVPVPLHRRKLAARGFNQACLVARAVARAAGSRWTPDALARTVDTGSQGGLSRAGRAENVRGAFAVPARGRRLVEGRSVLLVDDVWTTGATCRACAAALRAAGAAEVAAWTLARVE